MPAIFAPPVSPPPIGLSEQLTTLRRSQGLSLRRLALIAGLSHDSLGAWERGERLPRLPELEAALTALGLGSSERQRLIALVPASRALRHAQKEEAGGEGWAQAAGPMPAGGDLLRAMRLRRGMTQVETAKAVGVSQGRLAEWEQSGDWPDAGRLHTLCLVLGAWPEEVCALTAGVRLDLVGAGDLEERDPAAWMERIRRAWQGSHPLRDLRLVTLEARLWPLAARDEQIRPVLMAAYACHARSLTRSGRPAEAPAYAARALDLARAGYAGGDQWVWGVIATGITLRGSAEPEGQDGEAAVRRRGKRAADFLKVWEGMVRRPENRAWLWADLALSLRQAGEAEAAVGLSEKACRLASASDNPYEGPNRWHDLALLLVEMARFGPALEALDGARPLALLQADTGVLHLILEAECLLGLDRRAEAHDLARQALEGCAQPGFASLRPRAEALARRF